MVYVVFVCNAVKVKSCLGDGDQRQVSWKKKKSCRGKEGRVYFEEWMFASRFSSSNSSLWWSAESVGPNSRWAREDGSGVWW
jgi:hypothetical protein